MKTKFNYIEVINFVNYTRARIEFSTDPARPLTIVQAENGVGKTTLLHALAWCLTGEKAKLASNAQARDHQIFSSNWDVSKLGERVDVSVEVGYTVQDGRSLEEYVAKRSQRILLDPSRPLVYNAEEAVLVVSKKKPRNQGWETVNASRLTLNNSFPLNLKDIFFMNGDAALKFIESTRADGRRDEVEHAIRQLLKLDLFESAKSHLGTAKQKYRAQKIDEGVAGELAEVEKQLAAQEEDLKVESELLEEYRDAERRVALETDEARSRLDAALAAGVGEGPDLKAKRDRLEAQWTDQTSTTLGLVEQLRISINSSDLLFLVALPSMAKAKVVLDELEARGEIPNTLPVLLEASLRKGVCICGASLAEGSAGAQHIHSELNKTREDSDLNGVLLKLHQSLSVRLRSGTPGLEAWPSDHEAIQKRIALSDSTLDRVAAELSDVEAKINDIPDINITHLSDDWSAKLRSLNDLNRRVGEKTLDVSRRTATRDELKLKRRRLIQSEDKNNQITWRVETTEDLERFFEVLLERSKGEMVDDLSQLTNEYFARMISLGIDGDTSASEGFEPISGVEIQRDYEIVVKSQTQMPIPTNQISGAQQRALVVSLILALQQLSGNKGAKVIDTPLGMMSGRVKEEFARTAIELSDQLTLLVTDSEVSDIEELLKQKAGRWYKLYKQSKSDGAVFPGEIGIKEVE